MRGTDISPGACEVARQHGFDAFAADLTAEPLNGEYDYVSCFETIEHIHEAEKVLVAMRDDTRKQLIMSLPNIGYIESRVPELRGWTPEEADAYQRAALPTGHETDPAMLAEFIAFLLSTKERHQYLHGCDLPYGA